jgi:hypothetical protein
MPNAFESEQIDQISQLTSPNESGDLVRDDFFRVVHEDAIARHLRTKLGSTVAHEIASSLVVNKSRSSVVR